MKTELIEKVENPLLKRTEVRFKVDHVSAPTPKRPEVRTQLAALLGIAEDLLIIEKFTSTHGRHVASGIARAYSSREQLEEIEPKYLLKRGMLKEAKPGKPPEEKPKEAKPEKPSKEAKLEEKPAGKKEEKPKEAKPEKRKEAEKEEKPKGKPEKQEPKKDTEAKDKAKKDEVKEKPKEEDKGGKGKEK